MIRMESKVEACWQIVALHIGGCKAIKLADLTARKHRAEQA